MDKIKFFKLGLKYIFMEDHVKLIAFRFVKGPLFANIILADEINRTPARDLRNYKAETEHIQVENLIQEFIK